MQSSLETLVTPAPSPGEPLWLSRLLRPITLVEPGEATKALLLTPNVFLLLNSVAKRSTARARPDAEACAKDSIYERGCKASGVNASFYSGPATLTATSAGLTCTQHSELSLYGGSWDSAACATGIALSALTGGLRIVADRHWASDVITGDLLGFSAGYFLPQLLHFRSTAYGPEAVSVLGVLPVPFDDGVTLLAVGRF